jgi:hypothetical protein
MLTPTADVRVWRYDVTRTDGIIDFGKELDVSAA